MVMAVCEELERRLVAYPTEQPFSESQLRSAESQLRSARHEVSLLRPDELDASLSDRRAYYREYMRQKRFTALPPSQDGSDVSDRVLKRAVRQEKEG
jgi:hypothetical protein